VVELWRETLSRMREKLFQKNTSTSPPLHVVCCALVALVCLSPALRGDWNRGDLKDYRDRRARLARSTSDGVVVLFGYRDADVAASVTQFRQNEAFYYLSGWNEPEAMLMILPKQEGQSGETDILYLPARNPATERWNGPKLGPESPDAAARTGFGAVHRTGLFASELIEALKTTPKIYTELTPQPESGEEAFQADTVAKLKAFAPLAELGDIRPVLNIMRPVKSAGEQALIRKAAENSVDGHLALMKAVKPGMWEYELGALMKYEFERRGSEWPSYPAIVGSGFFSTVLHYNVNSKQMDGGELVVIDAAGSYGGYASDITRTLPVNGRFTPRHREIYDIVRGAQAAAFAAARPVTTMRALGRIAQDYINTHGKDLHGEPLGKYFIHGLGHSVGLNVHDPMDTATTLAPGMVLTIEPGIYIPEEKIGVRIEDMILITADGCEVLTKRLPSDPAEIERIMAVK